jgi:ATP-binding cassette subfamily B protein
LVIVEALARLIVPRLIQLVIDEGITPGVLSTIGWGAAMMLGAAVIGAAATVARAVYAAKFSQGLAYDLRNSLFGKIQSLSFPNLDHLQTGQLITRVSSDVDMVRMFAGMGLVMIIRAVTMLLGSLAFLVSTQPTLSLIMLILIPAIAGVFFSLARVARPLFRRVQERLAELNTAVQESLAGVSVVKAFVREEFEVQKFESANAAYMRQAVKVNRLMVIAFPSVLLIANLGVLAVMLFGGAQVIQGILSVGELVAFSNYLMTAMFPVVMLGMIIAMMPAAEASAERIQEVLDTRAKVRNRQAPKDPGDLRGDIRFEGVSFSYNGGSEVDALRDVHLHIKPGESVALLGATGSGKTTLVRLIPRLYDVSRGSVRVDGEDVRELDKRALRSRIAIVLQQTTLFSGTIAENIAFGRPDAGLEEIVAAAKAAQAHAFITTMPEAYQSPVESRGANLSGGQKQRIAIARALLVDPAILILDDSTSSVDMETEYQIQAALDEVMRNRTTLIIAQRLSSVLKANKIIILDQGRIVATGTHQGLLGSSRLYRQIYCSQLGEEFLPQDSPADCQDSGG